MGIFDSIEKLINEHGSATILKERIDLAKDKYLLLEDKNESLLDKINILESKVEILDSENQTLHLNLIQAEDKVRKLNKKISVVHNVNPDGYICDHCASPSLKRTGSRPDPMFGEVGIKQKVFICNECDKESFFTPDV